MYHGVTDHMFAALGREELDLIQRAYPQSQWLHEVEARYFEQEPTAVTTGVQRFCF